MARLIDIAALETRIAQLSELGFADLKARYAKLAGSPPPKRIGRRLLMIAVAYEIQCKAYGVRRDRLNKRLAVGRFEPQKKTNGDSPHRSLKHGGRLVREWRGKTYEVYVSEDGCYLDGKRYSSLSAVALSITGARWNGPRFFGLRSSRAAS